MTNPVTLPLWLFVLIVLFATVTFASHFLFPSVRWFFRRRMERAVARLNTRLQRPIEPFKLLRRYDLIQRLCYHPDVTQAIVDQARETGEREDVVFERARRYAREIVPSFSALAYFGWGVRGARLLSNALYHVELHHQAPERLAAIDPEATVIFVMNHRSNMDYVLITHLAADRSALSYAVGEWAQVWPLSRLIRAMGAYFIRRKSRNALYRQILRRYVQMATNGGVTQAIFPEGGLSLDGALQPPKLGLLSYMLDGLDKTEREIVFVPVALNYDRVLEDKVLVNAHRSGTRWFDASITHVTIATLKQVWQRITGRFRRFGTAAVCFGTPVSLADVPELAHRPEALADLLMTQIAGIVPILPVPLVARLLQAGPHSVAELVAAAARHCDTPEETVRAGLRPLIARGIVTPGEPHRITDHGRELADFYANSIRHLG